MINGFMLLAGLFLMSADSIPVVIVGLVFIAGVAYREAACNKQTKEKSSRWQANED